MSTSWQVEVRNSERQPYSPDMSHGNLKLFPENEDISNRSSFTGDKMLSFLEILDPEDDGTICDIEYNSPSD
jgi:hypothetical protein